MDSSKRIKKSPEEFANLISISFQKTIISEIFKECLDVKDTNEKSWRFKLINNKLDNDELYRITIEWLFLEILLQGKAILDYFVDKDNKKGYEIYKAFLVNCGEKLVSAGIFKTPENYYHQLNEKIVDYKEILKFEFNDPIEFVDSSYKILDRIAGNRDNWNSQYFLFFTKYYNDEYFEYRKIIRKMMEMYSIN